MTRYAVLLRGVNVGGNRKLPMRDLQSALEGLGHTEVSTYLQSGNAVVSTKTQPPAKLAAAIRSALAEGCGVDTDVLIRNHRQLAHTIEANPFPDAVAEPTRLYAVFTTTDPDPGLVASLAADTWAPDEFALGPGCLYQRFQTSPARSKLAAGLISKLKVIGTARNWNTVQALADRTA